MRRSLSPSSWASGEDTGEGRDLRLHLEDVRIVDPATFPRLAEYTEEFYSFRQRKGVTRTEAAELISTTPLRQHDAAAGRADALIGGLTTHYPDTIRPRCR